MDVIAFYHIACMGHWREVVWEQLRVLSRAGFPGLIRISFIGRMQDWPFVELAAKKLRLNIMLIHQSTNLREFESPALRELDAVCRAGYEGAVLYFHTKGVSAPGHPNKTYWRWIMNAYVLNRWEECVADLEDHDIAGVCWEDCDPRSHFCGNFWWARADWIRKLSGFNWYWKNPFYNVNAHRDPEGNRRFACEHWISSNNMRGAQRRVKSYFVTNGHIWQQQFWDSPRGIEGRLLGMSEGT